MSRTMWTMTLLHRDGRPPVTFERDGQGMAEFMETVLNYRDPGYTLVCVKPGNQGFTVSFK